MKRSLTIPEWHQMAQNGTFLPVRIPLQGYSMFPLIRYNSDLVTIMPIQEPLKKGDIVLFLNQTRNTYVVHRVWNIDDHSVLTWGDNCPDPDGWIPKEEVFGKAVLIERGNKRIIPDPVKGFRWARFWHKARVAYNFYEDSKVKIAKLIHKQEHEVSNENRD